jgi:hypothetical protein
MPSTFAMNLAGIAEDQHTEFHLIDEADPILCKQITRYWTELNLGFTSCVSVPWSAVFVSWCVKQAGATAAEFTFAAAHSEFVFQAIKMPKMERAFSREKIFPLINRLLVILFRITVAEPPMILHLPASIVIILRILQLWLKQDMILMAHMH